MQSSVEACVCVCMHSAELPEHRQFYGNVGSIGALLKNTNSEEMLN